MLNVLLMFVLAIAPAIVGATSVFAKDAEQAGAGSTGGTDLVATQASAGGTSEARKVKREADTTKSVNKASGKNVSTQSADKQEIGKKGNDKPGVGGEKKNNTSDEDISIEVSGAISPRMYFVKQKNKKQITVVGNSATIQPTRTDKTAMSVEQSLLSFNGSKGAGSYFGQPFKVGFKIALYGDMRATHSVKEAFATVEGGDFGTIYFGNRAGPEDGMSFNGSEVMKGIGGVKGSFTNVYQSTTGMLSPTHGFATTQVGSSGRATKIYYSTARFAGFALGCSYTPLSNQFGADPISSFASRNAGGTLRNIDRDHIAVVVNYLQKIGNFNISWSPLSYVTAHTRGETTSPATRRYNTKSIASGFIVGYNSLKVGAGFTWNGKSQGYRTAVTNVGYKYRDTVNGDSGSYAASYDPKQSGKCHGIDAGVSYAVNPTWTVSGGFAYTHRKTGYTPTGQNKVSKAVGNMVSWALDASVCKGFTITVVECDVISTRNAAAGAEAWRYSNTTSASPTSSRAVTSNKGYVLSSGLALKF